MNLAQRLYDNLRAQILEIDSRFTVEPATWSDDADKLHAAIRISMPHHVHGTLESVHPLSEGDLILFWPRQKKAMLDQTREEQIREFANSIGRSYEECAAWLDTNKKTA